MEKMTLKSQNNVGVNMANFLVRKAENIQMEQKVLPD